MTKINLKRTHEFGSLTVSETHFTTYPGKNRLALHTQNAAVNTHSKVISQSVSNHSNQ